LDDGTFGPGLVLNAFNYEKAYNTGVELTANYSNGGFKAYGNLAWGRQVATNIVSNQYLFSADDLGYIAGHYINTDHAQQWTASAGASYAFDEGTRVSLDMIYGSGLRADAVSANGDTVPNGDHGAPYAQLNAGILHEFKSHGDAKPFTARFTIVNLLDTVYQIRDGSGVGVFAPQYGPRRGFYLGLSKKL
jgi:hypothetical protein